MLKKPFIFLIYIGLSIFFNLNPCFLANSELISNCYNQHLLDTAWTRVKDNDDMIGCAISILVSTSYSRCGILTSISCLMIHLHCVLWTYSSWALSIYMLWDAWTLTIFIFLLFYFSDFILIFFSFYFSFGQWRGTWHCSHMTGHIMWCHRPRTW